MRSDPHPELRCRCVARRHLGYDDIFPNEYMDRCRNKATAEDGFCDHCRTKHQPGEMNCYEGACCFGDDFRRTWVSDPQEECVDFSTVVE